MSEKSVAQNKLTKLEKYWILYDVGNSAFTMLVSTLIPICFNSLAESAGVSPTDYLAYWGYAASISTLIVAFLGPILGTIADTKDFKKPIFTTCMMVGVIGCAALSLPLSWILFLTVFIIAKVGFSASLIFYDSMLTDVTTPDRMDMVSSHGYAWGYIGSCVPFILSLAVVLGSDVLGITKLTGMAIAFLINAAWWFLVTLPLLKNYKQIYYASHKGNTIKHSFIRLYETFRDIKKDKNIFVFLLAFFFYIDGVYTIIDMATAYGQSLGLDSQGLLLALLLTQIVAFPCALLFSWLAKKYKNTTLIRICIICYTFIALFAVQLDKQWEFWFLAICVGIFQGAIQALSRSYFARIIPPEKAGEYFGIYDIFGKGAAFLGTSMIAIIVQLTQKQNLGIAFIPVMFLIGIFFFNKSVKLNEGKNNTAA
ncbi:MAG TPA: MFS transporter [Clostridia bacterium]|nr:MFS transporter [Clostridia bacterium]